MAKRGRPRKIVQKPESRQMPISESRVRRVAIVLIVLGLGLFLLAVYFYRNKPVKKEVTPYAAWTSSIPSPSVTMKKIPTQSLSVTPIATTSPVLTEESRLDTITGLSSTSGEKTILQTICAIENDLSVHFFCQ